MKLNNMKVEFVMKLIVPIIVVTIVAFFVSCSNDDGGNVREDNEEAIQEYLTDNDITTAQSTPSGLYYVVEREGNGTFPTPTSRVTVNYKGYNLSGAVFDQSSQPVTFPLPNLIQGWQEGIPKFSVGGEGLLLVPAHLAYGNQAPSFNQPLVFEIELLGIQ